MADEPPAALDVTIQAQILDLLGDLQRETGMAIILITHDLGVVARMADEVMLMYAGQVVERGAVDDIFLSPAIPTHRACVWPAPTNHQGTGANNAARRDRRFATRFIRPPAGRYHPRCPYAMQYVQRKRRSSVL